MIQRLSLLEKSWTRRLRAVRYYGLRSLRFFRTLPFSLIALIFEPLGLQIWPTELRKGIRIVDPFPASREDFVSVVDEALTLVELKDPLRFGRLKREIRIIMNAPVAHSGAYARYNRSCRIDFRSIPIGPNRSSGLIILACLLVHESTHGYLASRRIAPTHRNYSRVERICAREEIRFARRIGVDLSGGEEFAKDVTADTFAERIKHYKTIKGLLQSYSLDPPEDKQ